MSVLFSVITPTFNRAHLIGKTAKSVLGQRYKNFEWIVIDDGSTDNTAQTIKELNDDRIRYFYIPNSERGAARNHGIKQAQGNYITFLDSDDVYYETYLQNALQFIEENNAPSFFHLAFEFLDEEGKVIAKQKTFTPEQLYKGNYMACLGIFIRKDVTEQELFCEDRALAGSEDYEYWIRLYTRVGLKVSDKLSAAMVFHKGRGEFNLTNGNKLIGRMTLLIELIRKEKERKPIFTPFQYRVLFGILYIFLAIFLVKIRWVKKSMFFLWKSLSTYPLICFNYYFYSYIANLLIKRNVRSR